MNPSRCVPTQGESSADQFRTLVPETHRADGTIGFWLRLVLAVGSISLPGLAQTFGQDADPAWKKSVTPFEAVLSVPDADEESHGPLPGVANAITDDSAGGAGDLEVEGTHGEWMADDWTSTGVTTVGAVEYDYSGPVIQVGGWIDQGVTWNGDNPQNHFNTPVLFNDRSNEYQLNQLNVFLETPVAADGTALELGGRVDFLFGTDFRFLTVPGLEEHLNGTRKFNSEDRRFYGFAMPQWYLELALPVLDGASFKFGHFYSIFGHDRVQAPENFFYSHTYTFAYGQPFTHSGMLAEFKLDPRFSLFAGLTTGWDNLRHPSDKIGFLGGFTWSNVEGWTELRFALHVGDDLTGVNLSDQPIVNNRFGYSLVLTHMLTDSLTWVMQHDLGFQEDGRMLVDNINGTIDFDRAHWYGITQHLIYEMDESLAAGLRFEWFADKDLSRTLAPVSFDPGGPIVTGSNYFALTAGLNWKPCEHIVIRPELRWDWSDIEGNPAAPGGNSNFRVFDDRSDAGQFLFSTDVIIRF